MDDKQAEETDGQVPVLDYAEPIEMLLPKLSMLLFYLSVPALGIGGFTVVFPVAGFTTGLIAVVKQRHNTRGRVALLLNALILVLWVMALAGVRF